MRKYPIGIQDFRELRLGDYLYIDKTAVIFKLLEQGKYYFLSRPRRFGKSLLLSTLKYLFLGKKELFAGLWIEHKHNWQEHPVIHLSFSSIGYKDLGLDIAIDLEINRFASQFDVQLEEKGIARKFRELIEKIFHKKGQVVLLIDEYDKPLVDYIDRPEEAEQNREILKIFYSVLKDADPHLRFFLITGVSKFSKVSLFSDLNNLDDLTLVPTFGSIAGYTQEEIDQYFQEDLKTLSEQEGTSIQDMRNRIKDWYNGYSWGNDERIYNPFSVLSLFRHKRIANYWWETGTPTFLVKKLREAYYFDLNEMEAGKVLFESFTLDNMNLISLLFQTGYLTIKSYSPEERLYLLDYPNLEVKDTMQQHLLGAFRHTHQVESLPLLVKIKRALEKEDLDRFIELIDLLFSTIPHQIFLQKQEAFFHAILHLSFSGIGMIVQSEVSTSKGRVDSVVHTKNHIYVMEFKLDASADSVLAQIRDKRYGSPFLNQEKEVIALGINFSSANKSVEEWRSVSYESLLVEG